MKVVPKLVLILSRRTCNTIYWNSSEAHVMYSALSFQQTPTGVRSSNISRVTTGFVKTIARVPLQKKKKKK